MLTSACGPQQRVSEEGAAGEDEKQQIRIIDGDVLRPGYNIPYGFGLWTRIL